MVNSVVVRSIHPAQLRIQNSRAPYRILTTTDKNCYKTLPGKRKHSRVSKSTDQGKDPNDRLSHQEDYIRNHARYLGQIRTLARSSNGIVKYNATYGQSSTGYKGRLFAKDISLQMAPRRIREIAYEGMGVRDWDVSSAYFNFALQAVQKLRINIPHSHFQLATVRRYIDDKQGAWKSLTTDTKQKLTDVECKYIFTSVFSGSTVPKEFATNDILRGIYREGRVIRWLSASVLPELYGRLCADPEKPWPEASAQSYFLAGIESRVIYSFYEYCKNLCSFDGGPYLTHMSLQFDGADVMIRPFPDNFRPQAETWIEERTGFRVDLVEKKHFFFAEYITREAVEISNLPLPPRTSSLRKPGNCILLALYRLVGNQEMAKVLEEVLLVRGNMQPVVRSYKECLEIIGSGYLTYAESAQLTVGRKFLIHADGRDNEPHCMSATVERSGAVKISTGDMQYVHHMRDFKEILSKSIDKPILMRYSENACHSAGSSNASSLGSYDLLLGMKAGNYMQPHQAADAK